MFCNVIKPITDFRQVNSEFANSMVEMIIILKLC